jgi:hypothetical protein
MNKKQKTLTVIALVVFGAIIVFHYVGWTVINYKWPWTEMRNLTSDDIEIGNNFPRAREALCGLNPVHGRFLRLDRFLLQNCATQRNAA